MANDERNQDMGIAINEWSVCSTDDSSTHTTSPFGEVLLNDSTNKLFHHSAKPKRSCSAMNFSEMECSFLRRKEPKEHAQQSNFISIECFIESASWRIFNPSPDGQV